MIARTTVIRTLYFTLGIAALLAAIAGLVLPLLPTTPFVLLAAACFARSSDRFYQAMIQHRLVGPILEDWRIHGAMKRSTKHWAAAVMLLSFGLSLWLVSANWHRVLLLTLAGVLGFFIWRVPVRPATLGVDAH